VRGQLIVAVLASAIVWAFGVFGGYGWFTDELYFLACAKRPALGYADHPPLAPLILTAVRSLAGDHLAVIRLVPVIAYAATIVLAGRLARQLGGGGFAQTLAALLIATAPAIMVVAGFFSMNPLEVLIAIGIAGVLVHLTLHDRPRWWLAYGALLGVGVLGKHTIVIPAGMFAVAALATPASPVRRHFATRWPYLGALIAIAIALPHVLWLAEHEWITLTFYGEATARKNVDTSPLAALVGQALFVGPLGFACAVAGSIALCRRAALRGFGVVLFVGLVAMMIAAVSRPDRIVGLYPLALAAGAVAIERATASRRTLRVVGLVVYALGVAVPLPLVVPVLHPWALAQYSARLGITPQLERGKTGAMPQWMADRLEWPGLVAQTGAAVATLTADERARVVVLADNYGLAGALERFGPEQGLHAPVISTHNSYWLWAPRVLATLGSDAVIVGVTHDEALLRGTFADVRRAGTLRCLLCFQDRTPVWIARVPRIPLAVVWPGLRHLE
jgi:4-amino-4-deoxy-L-arabinose transferase-like glycosyltransferase